VTKSDFKPAGLIFALVLVAYWPAMHGGVLWDDAAHIPRPDLQSWSGLGRIWSDLHATQQYYPVLFSSFWFQHRLWGGATFYYHLVNCLQHAASCVVFALLLRRLWETKAANAAPAEARAIPRGTEWLAAALFALHPVCVESVAWITEQKNTLSVLFYLLAAYTYLGFDARRTKTAYGLASGFFLLALGSKSVTATLPAALLVVLWWRNGRLEWRRDVVPLIPWLVVGVASGVFTAWVEHSIIGANASVYPLHAVQRLLLAGRVVCFYLGKLLWPADLMFFYPRWEDPTVGWAWGQWLGIALALTAALWLIRRRARGPLAAWLLFVGALVPVLGLFNVYFFLFSYVCDHFQYQASLPVFATAAGGLGLILAKGPAWARRSSLVFCGGVILTLGYLTHQQCRIYTDSETHYRAMLQKNPDSWMAHNNLGTVLRDRPGFEAEATWHFREAVRLNPDYAEGHNNLAIRLAHMPGHEQEAMAEYHEALRVFPDYPTAHGNLALLLARMPGHEAEAVEHFERMLRFRPDSVVSHYTLATLLEKMPGREKEAVKHYEATLRLDPGHAEAKENLARLLKKLSATEKPGTEKKD
jgi:protein O-mannosyl-transferase